MPLSQLKRGVEKYPQKMINVPVNDKSKLNDSPKVAEAVTEIESSRPADNAVVQ